MNDEEPRLSLVQQIMTGLLVAQFLGVVAALFPSVRAAVAWPWFLAPLGVAVGLSLVLAMGLWFGRLFRVAIYCPMTRAALVLAVTAVVCVLAFVEPWAIPGVLFGCVIASNIAASLDEAEEEADDPDRG